MLFNYTYISHDMEKIQKYMDFIFFEIWSKANKSKKYKISLYNKHKELKIIIKQLLITDSEGSDFFLKTVEEIYYIFQSFTLGEKAKIKRWYKINTNIKDLCNYYIKARPLDYKRLELFDKKLHNKLKELYSKLYGTNSINQLKEFKPYTKTIEEHYKKFMIINKIEICPFCGTSPMDNEFSQTRESYDHFLPKGKFPFSAINFKNLAPMCYKCNSGNKGTKNPIFDKQENRRKAFYPYGLVDTNINIKVDISTKDIKPENITLTITASEQEKVNTWLDLFSIEERYKAILCGVDKLLWLNQIIDEAPEFGLNTSEYLEIKQKQYLKNKYNEKNFLKVAFLKACKNNGII